MKRIIIFLVVGLVMFGAGFGGGLLLGRTMAPKDDNNGIGQGKVIQNPGPIVSIGEFTSNLAGAGRHVISFGLSLELVEKDGASAMIQSPGWLSRIRNEIFMLIKDRVYDDLTSAEGTLQFAGDIKRSLNRMLPDVGGEAPIVNVLFESIVLQ
ncbi:MAG: flagellar basal body-associated FliL family protein [Synergistaceae bacterium]|nr:flagellar basal body-associated FliL family protein [Synergistaceae bacterium]